MEYLEHLKSTYVVLAQQIKTLEVEISDGDEFNALHDYDRNLILRQYEAMDTYKLTLFERIQRLEGILVNTPAVEIQPEAGVSVSTLHNELNS